MDGIKILKFKFNPNIACHYMSYNADEKKCHLKDAGAPAGQSEDNNHVSAPKCCDSEDCLLRDVEYQATGFGPFATQYDIISNVPAGSIPGVNNTADCDSMCQLVPTLVLRLNDLRLTICFKV